jgi:futalosine hydrolase
LINKHMADLILVPTSGELEVLRPLLGATEELAYQVCGFGPITAAARTAGLIARYKPERVILVGIAGSFDVSTHPVGTACRFDEVGCDGVGVGCGPHHQNAGDLGWLQFAGRDNAQPQIGDVIRLASTFVTGLPSAGQLLTVCSASANPDEAINRRRLYPQATAEDMEGFAVAVACALASVPLQIVRGISNQVGDRDHAHWRVQDALHAAAQLALQLMPETWMPSQS